MGLLDQIKKKTQPKHQLNDSSLEIKINYLQAVAFFIAIDDTITENEKETFNNIIKLLDCEEMEDDLYSFLENPDLSEFDNIFKFIRENNYSAIYIKEILYISKEQKLNLKQQKFLKLIFPKQNIYIESDWDSAYITDIQTIDVQIYEQQNIQNSLLEELDKLKMVIKQDKEEIINCEKDLDNVF